MTIQLHKLLAEYVPVMGTSIMYLSSFLKVKSFILLIYFFVLGKWAANYLYITNPGCFLQVFLIHGSKLVARDFMLVKISYAAGM